MSDKKHIDRLFQEKLKDFETTPNHSVWENITKKLHSDKKQRKVVPLWWKIAGIAAGLLLLITISNSFLNTNKDIHDENVVNSDSKNNTQDSISANSPLKLVDANISETVSKENVVEKDTTNSTQKLNTFANGSNSPSFKNEDKSTEVVSNKTKGKKSNIVIPNINRLLKSKNENAITQKIVIPNDAQRISKSSEKIIKTYTDNELVGSALKKTNRITSLTNSNSKKEITKDIPDIKTVQEEKLSLTEEIAANEEGNIEDPTNEEFERWEAASNIAPVYFNAFGKGSSIHSQFNNNSKTGNINMSYGVSGSYAFNKKLRIRTGVNKVNLGYSTNDVVVFINVSSPNNPQFLRNVAFNETGQNLSFISIENFNFAQVSGVFNDFIKSSIDQKLGFIEIPLELEYNISSRIIDINLIGGFSTLFLSDNEIFSVQNGKSTLLGKANNINSTSFTANFGLGFDFKISKTFNFNLDPMFKYQINTFNNTSGNFKPFFIGVYTGLKFKF